MKIDINIPDGKSGNWSVETFTVEKNELSQVFSMLKSGRGVPEGTYKRLCRNGHVIMSNTPDEIRDFMSFVYKANGSILINGLGLGVLLQALLNKETITDITIIEKERDVINLIVPYINDDRVKFIHANALDYIPPKDKKYNFVWHDIWDDICANNLIEMKTLHRKYGKKTEYQESWCRHRCEYQANQDKQNNRYNKYF